MQKLKKLFELLFKKKESSDDLRGFSNMRVGLASGAAWCWGVSFFVGIGALREFGVLPFLMWVSGNVLALPLYGAVRKYLPLSRLWPTFVLTVFLFMMVDYFAITINMKAIMSGFGYSDSKGLQSYQFFTKDVAIYFTVGYSLLILWYMTKGGLRFLMFSDLGSYIMQMITVIFMAVASNWVSGGQMTELVWSTQKGIMWVFKFAFLGILTGALATGHQWQKYSAIQEERILPVALWGGFFFAFYMSFVFLSGLYFTVDRMLGIAFLIVMIALATSTIDSASAAMTYNSKKLGIKNNYIGPILAFLTMGSWTMLLTSKTIMDLWNIMAAIRAVVICGLIIATVLIMLAIKKNGGAFSEQITKRTKEIKT